MDVTDLAKALECSCCFEEPRPDTTVFGICNNGHVTCRSCGTEISNRTFACPICRHSSFRIVKGHRMAMAIIQTLTQHVTYDCSHDECTTRLQGNLILQHEKECPHKPVQCPNLNCSYRGGVYRYLGGTHKCVRVCEKSEATNSWMCTLNIGLVYSVDYNVATVSDRFKPIVLKGSVDGLSSSAYINIASKDDAILIYSGWLNRRQHVDINHQNTKITINAYIHTNVGRIGQFVSQFPKYEDEFVTDDSDGIYLSRETLFNWSDWSNAHHCEICDNRRQRPHMHLEIKMSV